MQVPVLKEVCTHMPRVLILTSESIKLLFVQRVRVLRISWVATLLHLRLLLLSVRSILVCLWLVCLWLVLKAARADQSENGAGAGMDSGRR